jgi:hypothetical protein
MADRSKGFPSLLAFFGVAAAAGLAALQRQRKDEREAKERFTELVLDSGLAEGHEDQAWQVWQLARRDFEDTRRRMHRAEATLERCEELAQLVQGLRACGRMIEDESVPDPVKASILAHWANRLMDLTGRHSIVVPADLERALTQRQRDDALRQEAARQRARAEFWRRVAEQAA